MELLVGIDIGGTFTDVVGYIGRGRPIVRCKVLSTPPDYVGGVLVGVDRVVSMLSLETGEAAGSIRIVHGTTLATNLILERRGAQTILVTTAGFRDVLELGRGMRPTLLDLQWTKSSPLVDRAHRLEVAERTLADGTIEASPSAEALKLLVAECEAAESIAICLLNSPANPTNEEVIEEAIRAGTNHFVTRSTAVASTLGEFERTSTAVANAYVGPQVRRYLSAIEDGLASRAVQAKLEIMQSNGGTLSVDEARRMPVRLVESGPAAGILSSAHLARQLGIEHAISFDMGGTTTKASLVDDGVPSERSMLEIGTDVSHASRLLSGGYPLSMQCFDLAEVGVGGGSIVRVDEHGTIHIGPHSAGAVPGPACYGLGGTEATVTDANVVLGFIDPQKIGGGTQRIDSGLACEAIGRNVASALGLTVEAAAEAIHVTANSLALRAIRGVSVERGKDPSLYTLIAYGGSGPIHACGLAELMGVDTVVVPPLAGLHSAVGLCVADAVVDEFWSISRPLESLDLVGIRQGVNRRTDELKGRIDGANGRLLLFARAKYGRQVAEFDLPLDFSELEGDWRPSITAALSARFFEEFGVHSWSQPVLAGFRLRLVVPRESKVGFAATASEIELADANPVSAKRQTRWGGRVLTAIAITGRVGLRDLAEGPLIIDEPDCGIVVPPGWSAHLEASGSLLCRRLATPT